MLNIKRLISLFLLSSFVLVPTSFAEEMATEFKALDGNIMDIKKSEFEIISNQMEKLVKEKEGDYLKEKWKKKMEDLGIQDANLASPDEVKLFVDSDEVYFPDQKPILKNGKVYVPVRGFFEQVGMKVDYEASTQKILLLNDQKQITIKINNPTATINNRSVSMDTAPFLLNGRSFIPVRFIAENFGMQVKWVNHAVYIFTSDPEYLKSKLNSF